MFSYPTFLIWLKSNGRANMKIQRNFIRRCPAHISDAMCRLQQGATQSVVEAGRRTSVHPEDVWPMEFWHLALLILLHMEIRAVLLRNSPFTTHPRILRCPP